MIMRSDFLWVEKYRPKTIDDCIRILIEKISIGDNVCVFGEFVGVNYKYITPETQALIDHNVELYKDDYFHNRVELYKDEDGKWRKRDS